MLAWFDNRGTSDSVNHVHWLTNYRNVYRDEEEARFALGYLTYVFRQSRITDFRDRVYGLRPRQERVPARRGLCSRQRDFAGAGIGILSITGNSRHPTISLGLPEGLES
jgi:hypothetical protein